MIDLLCKRVVFAGAMALVGCVNEPSCSKDAPLGSIKNETTTVSRLDVEALRGKVLGSAGQMTEKEALADLLWQEKERIRLGLPGGEDAATSRQKVVLDHGRRIRSGEVSPLRKDSRALPPDAQLTQCGRRLWDLTDSSAPVAPPTW